MLWVAYQFPSQCKEAQVAERNQRRAEHCSCKNIPHSLSPFPIFLPPSLPSKITWSQQNRKICMLEKRQMHKPNHQHPQYFYKSCSLWRSLCFLGLMLIALLQQEPGISFRTDGNMDKDNVSNRVNLNWDLEDGWGLHAYRNRVISGKRKDVGKGWDWERRLARSEEGIPEGVWTEKLAE